MKTLLLTDIPPTHSYTAGLVTAQMCRAMRQGELAAFVIMNGELRPARVDDLAWIPTAFTIKPSELGNRRLGRFNLGELAAFIHETRTRFGRTSRLVEEAVCFGREQGVTQVWAILQGQTMVRVSRRVARQLGVPLKTQIWDPLSWWHRAWGVDRINRYWDNREWKRTLTESVIVASASPAMSHDITERFGTTSVPIIAAVDIAASHEAATGFVRDDEFAIGMAGQFYAIESWTALCEALDQAGWTIDGRKVVLHVLGASPPPNAIPEQHIRFHGWLDQTDAISCLASNCDVLYCPYPFKAEMAEVSRLSFPSKIVIYLASGRPIFFHGPAYSSPRGYLLEANAAVTCESLEPVTILDTLQRFPNEPGLYGELAAAGRRAFLRDFTTDRQRELVRRFMDVGASSGATRAGPSALPRQTVSEAFDPWFYLHDNESARRFQGSLIDHYQQSGWREHHDPVAWFSVRDYLQMYPDVDRDGIEPLSHYLDHGWREGRNATPLFSTLFYLQNNPSVREAGTDPFRHYRQEGWRQGLDPAPWFSTTHYGSFDPSGGIDDPLTHYARLGWREGREPNDWFSPSWYLRANPDVQAAGIEPLQHYLRHGWREHRDPNDWFSVSYYLAQYPDVALSGGEPMDHYIRFGRAEQRATKPPYPSEAVRLMALAERLLTDISFTIQDDLGKIPNKSLASTANRIELLRAMHKAMQTWLSDRLDEACRTEDDQQSD